jgi:hypothetical protein
MYEYVILQAFVSHYLRGKKLYSQESWPELVEAMEAALRYSLISHYLSG